MDWPERRRLSGRFRGIVSDVKATGRLRSNARAFYLGVGHISELVGVAMFA